MTTLLGALMNRFAPGRKHTVIFCYADGRDSDWEAFCLNFDLEVQGASFDDVRAKLNEAIEIYLEGVRALPKEEWARMVNRRAPLSSDFDTYFRNLLSNQPLMDREKAVGTTQARFGQLSPVYGSEDWPGEGGGGWAVIRIIGGSATPTAWNTAPEQPGAAARSRSLLPP